MHIAIGDNKNNSGFTLFSHALYKRNFSDTCSIERQILVYKCYQLELNVFVIND
jgi:hypothetical protein